MASLTHNTTVGGNDVGSVACRSRSGAIGWHRLASHQHPSTPVYICIPFVHLVFFSGGVIIGLSGLEAAVRTLR